MKNMKVSMKLIVGFLIVAALAAIVGAVGIVGMAQISNADTELYNMNLVAVRAMGNINDAVSSLRMYYRNYVIYEADHPSFISSEQAITEINGKVEIYMNNYQGTITDPDDQARFDQIKAMYNTVLMGEVIPTIREAGLKNDTENAKALLEQYGSPIQQLDDLIEESVAYNTQAAEDAVRSNQKLFQTMTIIAVIVIVIAAAMAIALGLYISGLISKPMGVLTAFMRKAGSTGDITLRPEDVALIEQCSKIRDEIGQCISFTASFVQYLLGLSKGLETIADGDLTVEVAPLSKDDVMGLSMKKMINNLGAMFNEIRTASDQVSSGAGQVSQGAQELASGSSEQAASIQQFSASLTELQEKTNHNADNSAKVRDINNKTGEKLDDSIRSMGQMLEAMKAIDESSASITKVIKVIDDIAFQTNILALNAAVEAARAGQHGKGFAVVADEVRNLASKSAAAAKETAALIEGSSERVREGNQIVAKTNADLEAATVNARESTRLIELVTVESAEQAQSIQEINQGIDQISTVVQANSATAEQSAAASEEMSAQATVLKQIVARFKLQQSAAGNRMVDSQPDSSGFSLTDGGKY